MGVHRFHPPAWNRVLRDYQRRFKSGTSGKAFNKKLLVKSQNNKNRTSRCRRARDSRMFWFCQNFRSA